MQTISGSTTATSAACYATSLQFTYAIADAAPPLSKSATTPSMAILGIIIGVLGGLLVLLLAILLALYAALTPADVCCRTADTHYQLSEALPRKARSR